MKTVVPSQSEQKITQDAQKTLQSQGKFTQGEKKAAVEKLIAALRGK